MSEISFERIHEIGAERHPTKWITANAAAARWIEPPFSANDPDTKRLVSMVVLRVLDATGPAAEPAAPTETHAFVESDLVDWCAHGAKVDPVTHEIDEAAACCESREHAVHGATQPAPAVPKCPRCGSIDKAERKEVYSDSSHYDFTECGDPWHRAAPPVPAVPPDGLTCPRYSEIERVSKCDCGQAYSSYHMEPRDTGMWVPTASVYKLLKGKDQITTLREKLAEANAEIESRCEQLNERDERIDALATKLGDERDEATRKLAGAEKSNDGLLDVIADVWAVFGLDSNRDESALAGFVKEKLAEAERKYAELKDGYRLRVEDIDDLQEKLEQAERKG